MIITYPTRDCILTFNILNNLDRNRYFHSHSYEVYWRTEQRNIRYYSQSYRSETGLDVIPCPLADEGGQGEYSNHDPDVDLS